jgi:bacterioferritin
LSGVLRTLFLPEMVSEWELQSGSPFGSLATYEIPRALHFALYRGNRIAPVPAFCDTRSAMKGNPKVIAELNKALREELTAINQYFLHAEMCENWGYHKLSEFIKKQSIGEMKHAEVLIERILFLDGSPSMQPLELTVGGTVKAMIESDLALEIGAVKQYNDAVALATKEGDNGSRDLLVQLLKDEESHVDFLEAQMHLIKELGYERYLTQQMGEDEEE